MRPTLAIILAAAGLTLGGCATAPNAHPLPDVCHVKPDAGNGQASATGFYYDADSDQCKSFTHGENARVPFQDLETCMAQCYAPAPDRMPRKATNQHPQTERVQ